MSIQKIFFSLYVCLFVTLAGLLGTMVGLLDNEVHIEQAQARKNRSDLLADELRQSSDDLTRMARLYAVTGELRYRKHFEEILAIRNGEAPRPSQYNLVYWDLVGPDGKRPRPYGPKEALSVRMAEEGFTDEELGRLKQAQGLSDALVRLEDVAMNAVEGRFDDGTGTFSKKGAPDLEMARALLFGDEYMQHKRNIMVPVNEFLVMAAGRTAEEVERYVDRRWAFAAVALALSFLTAIATGLAFYALRRRVIRPLSLAVATADSVVAGNLGDPIDYRSTDEMGTFIKAFNGMMQRVAEMMNALQADNMRLGAELDVARKLQQMLVPSNEELQQIPGLDIAGHMQPASEVGGDYYDVLQHDGRTKIGIGDVTGHGLESGVMSVMTQCVIRALLIQGEKNPVHFLDTLNRTLYANVQRLGSDKNLTLSIVDYEDGQVKVSGQHEYMLVVRDDGKLEVVDTADLGFPIALENDISRFVNDTTVQLGPGDGVVLYTDGVTEAENEAGEQYGLERLCEVVQNHWSGSAEETKAAVVKDLDTYIGEQTVYDDITLVVAKQR